METETNERSLAVHWHQVKFIEDLKNEGKEGDLCHACEEQLLGRGFKCPECNFLCHESCGLLDLTITHPFHPHHSLELFAPFRYNYCDACGKCCRRCFAYCCPKCDFTLDTICASRWRVKKNTCDNHAFVPLVEHFQFTCDFCGEEGKDNVRICSVCLLTIHSRCARFSRTIKIEDHPHSLTLTYSTHEEEKQKKEAVKEKEEAEIVCKLCSDKVNAKYAAYFCQECRYAVHLKCGGNRVVMEERDAITGSLPIEYHGCRPHIIKDMNQAVIKISLAGTINHPSHQHKLILDNGEVADDKVCDGCIQPISVPFYSCASCNFFLHSLCANLPTSGTYGGVSLNHNLSLQDGVFCCDHCKRYRHGFAYESEILRLDLQCFIMQGKVLHEGHQHPLFHKDTPKCNCCERRGYFSCFPCNFSLCQTCATSPLEVSCKFHNHPLKMTYTTEDNFGEYYCFICERERNPKYWFYYCVRCDFSAHLECVVGKYSYLKFEKTYKDKGHQHPLTFIQKTFESSSCDACGLDFKGVALHCKECRFNVHPNFEECELIVRPNIAHYCLENIDHLTKND